MTDTACGREGRGFCLSLSMAPDEVFGLEPASRPGGGTDAVAALERHLAAQEALSSKLGLFADRLPDAFDGPECLYLARSIYPALQKAHAFEEAELFPLLRRNSAERADLSLTLDRLTFEHFEDETFAEELVDTLVDHVCGRMPTRFAMLRTMLRSFCEGISRHLAFERAHLVPMLRQLENAGHA
ncbi:hemerythrin domain-containing protein [Jiella sp. M17.18]|uniref:hemerythrin domain-containing protein n=1 Tax=Jiella sp. M17.18 TaxID=3234247 RepID=UPI0034DE6B69